MKRHILLACATLCGTASAQSSVTIYGIADAMLTNGSTTAANTRSRGLDLGIRHSF